MLKKNKPTWINYLGLVISLILILYVFLAANTIKFIPHILLGIAIGFALGYNLSIIFGYYLNK